MILSRKHKSEVRSIASVQWNSFVSDRFHGDMPAKKLVSLIQKAVVQKIKESRSFKSKGPVGSIVTSILISIAIRFATKLIMSWLEDQLDLNVFGNSEASSLSLVHPGGNFQPGEPS